MSLTLFMHPSVAAGDKENQEKNQTALKDSDTNVAWWAAESESGGDRKIDANDFVVGGERRNELRKRSGLSNAYQQFYTGCTSADREALPPGTSSVVVDPITHLEFAQFINAPGVAGFAWNTPPRPSFSTEVTDPDTQAAKHANLPHDNTAGCSTDVAPTQNKKSDGSKDAVPLQDNEAKCSKDATPPQNNKAGCSQDAAPLQNNEASCSTNAALLRNNKAASSEDSPTQQSNKSGCLKNAAPPKKTNIAFRSKGATSTQKGQPAFCGKDAAQPRNNNQPDSSKDPAPPQNNQTVYSKFVAPSHNNNQDVFGKGAAPPKKNSNRALDGKGAVPPQKNNNQAVYLKGAAPLQTNNHAFYEKVAASPQNNNQGGYWTGVAAPPHTNQAAYEKCAAPLQNTNQFGYWIGVAEPENNKQAGYSNGTAPPRNNNQVFSMQGIAPPRHNNQAVYEKRPVPPQNNDQGGYWIGVTEPENNKHAVYSSGAAPLQNPPPHNDQAVHSKGAAPSQKNNQTVYSNGAAPPQTNNQDGYCIGVAEQKNTTRGGYCSGVAEPENNKQAVYSRDAAQLQNSNHTFYGKGDAQSQNNCHAFYRNDAAPPQNGKQATHSKDPASPQNNEGGHSNGVAPPQNRKQAAHSKDPASPQNNKGGHSNGVAPPQNRKQAAHSKDSAPPQNGKQAAHSKDPAPPTNSTKAFDLKDVALSQNDQAASNGAAPTQNNQAVDSNGAPPLPNNKGVCSKDAAPTSFQMQLEKYISAPEVSRSNWNIGASSTVSMDAITGPDTQDAQSCKDFGGWRASSAECTGPDDLTAVVNPSSQIEFTNSLGASEADGFHWNTKAPTFLARGTNGGQDAWEDDSVSASISAQHAPAGKETAKPREVPSSSSAPQGEFKWNTEAADFVATDQARCLAEHRRRRLAKIAAGKDNKQERRIFVGGLASSCRRLDLRAYFQNFGKVSTCHINFDDDNKSRRFGFVTFSKIAEKDAALAQSLHLVCNRWVQVHFCIPRGNSELDIRKEIVSKAKGKLEEAMLDEHSLNRAIREIEIECAWETREQARREMRQRSSQPNTATQDFSVDSDMEDAEDGATDDTRSDSDESVETTPPHSAKYGPFTMPPTELYGAPGNSRDSDMNLAKFNEMHSTASRNATSSECVGNADLAWNDVSRGELAQNTATKDRVVEAESGNNEMRRGAFAQYYAEYYAEEHFSANAASSKDEMPRSKFAEITTTKTFSVDAKSPQREMPCSEYYWNNENYASMMDAALAKNEMPRCDYDWYDVDENNMMDDGAENTEICGGKCIEKIAEGAASAKNDKPCSEYAPDAAGDANMVDAALAQNDLCHIGGAASGNNTIIPDEFARYAVGEKDMVDALSVQNEISCGAVGWNTTSKRFEADPEVAHSGMPRDEYRWNIATEKVMGPESATNDVPRDKFGQNMTVQKNLVGAESVRNNKSQHFAAVGKNMVDAESSKTEMPRGEFKWNTAAKSFVAKTELAKSNMRGDTFAQNFAAKEYVAAGDIDEEEKEFLAGMMAFTAATRVTQRMPPMQPDTWRNQVWTDSTLGAQIEPPKHQKAEDAFKSIWNTTNRAFISDKDNIWSSTDEQLAPFEGVTRRISNHSLAWNMPLDRRCTLPLNIAPCRRILEARTSMAVETETEEEKGIFQLPGYEEDKTIPLVKRYQYIGEYVWKHERFIVVQAPEYEKAVPDLLTEIASIMCLSGDCDIRETTVYRPCSYFDKKAKNDDFTALRDANLSDKKQNGSSANSEKTMRRFFNHDESSSSDSTDIQGALTIQQENARRTRIEEDLRRRFLHPNGAIRLDDRRTIKRRHSF